jgi:pilus assembly protein Flp/PilA
MSGNLYIKRLLRDDRGATAVEYGLIVTLIVVAMMAALQNVANETNGLWATVSNEVSEHM